MPRTVLILGASVRAAAFSALRAGFTPRCADLFADADLRRVATALRVDDYPAELATAAQTAPEAPWMYTGGLENHPDLVECVSSHRPLLGNPPDVLRRARNPFQFARAMADGGLAATEVRPSPDGLPADGSWLRKPRSGAGGAGISTWRGGPSFTDGDYFQQRIEGTACSAVFVAAARRAVLLGITRQRLVSRPEADGPYQYAGSIGPLRLAPDVEDQARRIGQAAAAAFDLAGLFGVDVVLADRVLWPVEINPRYPASVEVLERALGLATVGLHVAACREGRLPEPPTGDAASCYGKAILYARREVVVDESFTQVALDACNGRTWPEVADVPMPGQRIAAGAPLMTVFAQHSDPESVDAALCDAATRWEARLSP